MSDPCISLARPLSSDILTQWVAKGWRVPMLTCYDAPTARALTEGGVQLLLVGDSVGPVILGLESVRDVTPEMIAHHTGAVRRGAPEAVIVADLPYCGLASQTDAIRCATQLLAAGADLIKVEASASRAPLVRALVEKGVQVMGHVGHKPQEYHAGPRVTGATAGQAAEVFNDARALVEAGASMILMECVPGRVAEEISRRLTVPTIGIGSGVGCGGQVLVVADLLGWYDNKYRFVVKLDDLHSRTRSAAADYARKVWQGEFPSEEHTFKIKDEELQRFLNEIGG